MADSRVSGPSRARLPGIEGLRAFAAGAIVLLHAWSIPATAGVVGTATLLSIAAQPLHDGVTLFFVLSGFLLWRPFARSIATGRELPSIRRYARNRALRMPPAYSGRARTLRTRPGQRAPRAALGCTRWPARSTTRRCSRRTRCSSRSCHRERSRAGSEPAWSLSVEVTFYLLLPLLGLLAFRLASGLGHRGDAGSRPRSPRRSCSRSSRCSESS